MLDFLKITFKSLLKDRGVVIVSASYVLFIFIPVFGSLSMRQVQEVGITMCLTLNSFILLLLSIFGAIATVWRDIERRSIYNMLSFPISRTEYLLGRLSGCLCLLALISLINFVFSIGVIKLCASMYKSRLPILWANVSYAFLFTLLKYALLLAIGFLFISFSTSFFTPLFLTISVYVIGNASQGLYEFILGKGAEKYPEWFKWCIKAFYYVMPNFSAFDFTAYAAYALKVSKKSLIFSGAYFVLYFSVVVTLACMIFSKRDIT